MTRSPTPRLLALLLVAVPALSFAGSWRVVEEHGVWWFERADGTRMLSRGVDCTGPGVEAKAYDPAKPEYSFALRKRDTYADWQSRPLKRCDLWGFNTIAGWSDSRVEKAGLPYTPVLHLGIQAGAPWGDLWDPAFGTNIRRLAGDLMATHRGDPNVLGYFLDNEFGWGDEWFLGIALGWGSEAPGKHRVVDVLKGVYRNDWKAFLKDFETTAKNWDGLLTATTTGTRPGRGHRAIDAWTFEVARKYYAVCAGVVREVHPGALVLGDRFRQFYPQAVARAARGLLDAISTNYESTTTDGWVSPCYFRTMHELSGLPVVVGEYYATARQNRSGLRNHGGEFTLVDTQTQRGVAAAAQLRAFASFPFVIGWHWFQWCDEPTFGRGDGEDYNMGLVDIYDEPYADFLAAVVPANREADRIHAAAREPAAPSLPVSVRRQTGLVADGKLGDWDKSRPVPRALIKTDSPLVPFGDVFLAWDDANLWIAVRAYDFTIPARVAPDPRDAASWGELHRISARVDDWRCRAATGKVSSGKKDDEGRSVLYAVPPARGSWSGALSSWVDAWHYVWEIAVPAEALGGTPVPGRKYRLALVIENRGDFEKMWLDFDIELEGRPEPARERSYWYPADEPMPVRDEPAIRVISPPPPLEGGPLDDTRPRYRSPVRPVAPAGAGPVAPPGVAPADDRGPTMHVPKKVVRPPGTKPGAKPVAPPPAVTPVTPPPTESAADEGTTGPATEPAAKPPADKGKPAKEKHEPEKPATPETKSPVDETKVVPGNPPAENPGQAAP